MRVVLKIGGSLLYGDDGRLKTNTIREYASVVRDFFLKGNRIALVVGGGKAAREFVTAARELGANESQCDWLGIKMARHNAELMIVALGESAYPSVPETLEEFERALCSDRIVVMGGLTPGQSTNAVAALTAEVMGAEKLLNATNVDGVFDRNPREPGAKILHTLSVEELNSILTHTGVRAGEYELFDPVAIRIIARSRIRTVIFNGTVIENLRRALAGESVGSVVTGGS